MKFYQRLKGLFLFISFCCLLSVGFLIHDHTNNENNFEVEASYYYEAVDTSGTNFSIFGSVSSINESYFYGVPSYTEDESFQRWGTFGDYYIIVNSYYEEGNRITDVSLQYKLKNCFLIDQSDASLGIEDIYSFNGDFLTVGTGRVGTNKVINAISLQQYYIFVDDDNGGNGNLSLGLRLYFKFDDNTNAGVSFDYLVYTGVLSDYGSEYEDNHNYLMDSLNISQTIGSIASNNQDYIDNVYNDGYGVGYNNGYADGVESSQEELNDYYNNGYNAGYNDGYNADSVVSTIFSGIIQVALVPVNFFLGIFNFEILGINLRAFIQALFTIVITIIIVKTVFGGKGGDSSD